MSAARKPAGAKLDPQPLPARSDEEENGLRQNLVGWLADQLQRVEPRLRDDAAKELGSVVMAVAEFCSAPLAPGDAVATMTLDGGAMKLDMGRLQELVLAKWRRGAADAKEIAAITQEARLFADDDLRGPLPDYSAPELLNFFYGEEQATGRHIFSLPPKISMAIQILAQATHSGASNIVSTAVVELLARMSGVADEPQLKKLDALDTYVKKYFDKVPKRQIEMKTEPVA